MIHEYEYTPDELARGRFLRHFMAVDKRGDDITEEQLAIPAGAERPLPKTRVIVRPRRVEPASSTPSD